MEEEHSTGDGGEASLPIPTSVRPSAKAWTPEWLSHRTAVLNNRHDNSTTAPGGYPPRPPPPSPERVVVVVAAAAAAAAPMEDNSDNHERTADDEGDAGAAPRLLPSEPPPSPLSHPLPRSTPSQGTTSRDAAPLSAASASAITATTTTASSAGGGSCWGNPVRSAVHVSVSVDPLREEASNGPRLLPAQKAPKPPNRPIDPPPTTYTPPPSEDIGWDSGAYNPNTSSSSGRTTTSDWGPPSRTAAGGQEKTPAWKQQPTDQHPTSDANADTQRSLARKTSSASSAAAKRIDFAGQTTTYRYHDGGDRSLQIRRYYASYADDDREQMRCWYMPTTAPAIETIDDPSAFEWVPKTLPRADPPVDDRRYSHSRAASSSRQQSPSTETDDYDSEEQSSSSSSSSSEFSIRVHDNNNNVETKHTTTNYKPRRSRLISSTHPSDPFKPAPATATTTLRAGTASATTTTTTTSKKPNHIVHFAACLLMLLIPGLTLTSVYFLRGFENDR